MIRLNEDTLIFYSVVVLRMRDGDTNALKKFIDCLIVPDEARLRRMLL